MGVYITEQGSIREWENGVVYITEQGSIREWECISLGRGVLENGSIYH